MKLFFREYGTGKPMIMLHGLLGMSDHWIPAAKQFSNNFRVIIPDLRNHGQSPHSTDFSYEIMQSDIAELMHELNINTATVIGHSMGGKLAMLLALNHPEKVEQLIVEDISPVEYSADENHEIIQAIGKIHLSAINNREELRQSVLKATPDPMLQGLISKNMTTGTDHPFMWKPDISSISDNLTNIYSFPVSAEKNYYKQTLFIKGGNSPYIADSHMSTIHQFFPQAKISTVEDSGHWVHAEKPVEFFEACRAFLL